MKQLSTMAISSCLLLLSGCSVFNRTPAPPPAPESHAVEISRDMVGSLAQIGKVTVNERGSPMDAKNAIQKKADAQHASYYQILLIDEAITPGVWRGEALLYK